MSLGTHRNARRKIKTALIRRKETFAVSHLAWAAGGYTLKFRQGTVDIVRTSVDRKTLGDQVRLDKLLDGIRSDLRIFNSAKPAQI
jgi:hypothetical protein